MNTDLDHDDLDVLLRRTLSGRAATVSTGPAWQAVPPHRLRTPWIAAAAAAVAVLGLAGGIAYLTPTGDRTGQSGADAPAACRTTLPIAWSTALRATPTTIEGRPAYAQAITPDGQVIAQWIGADHVSHVALVSTSGHVTELDSAPKTRLYDGYDTDGKYVVLSSSRNFPVGNPDSPIDDVTVIDLATGRHSSILGAAAIPRGWTISLSGAVVQAGMVYVAIAPPGRNADSGRILRYDIATKKFTQLAKVTSTYPVVVHDVRGVGWPGGSVPNRSAPTDLPGFFVSHHGELQEQATPSDGTAAAWTDPNNPFVLHWVDGQGATSSYIVHARPTSPTAFQPEVAGVSGRFVVLTTNDTGDPNIVLDARTGAFAGTTNTAEQIFSARGALIFGSAQHGVLRVPTDSLPDLRC